MKWNKVKYLLFFSLFSLNVNANDVDDDLPVGASRPIDYDVYVGANYKQNWTNPKGEWRKFFVNSVPSADVYLGWRFTQYFAIEFGYEWSNDKPKSLIVPNNSSLMGIKNNTGTDILMTGKIRYKTGHVDLNAFLPFQIFRFIPEGIISIGVGGMKPHIRITSDPTQKASTDPFTTQFTPIDGRSKAVLRAGLGLQTLVFEQVGIRILWRYENTSVLKARNSTVTRNTVSQNLFQNSNSLALGIYAKF